MTSVGTFLRRSWLGLAYGAVLCATAFIASRLSEAQTDAMTGAISTNLDNMTHRPAEVLVGSALVVDGSMLQWATLAVVGLIVCQHWIGAGWTAVFAILGNAVPTLISLGFVEYGLSAGWYDASIRTTDDFGVSYVVASLLGILLWRIPNWRWRGLYLVAVSIWLWPLVQGMPQDFTAVGHFTAFLTGLAMGAIALRYLAKPVVAAEPQAELATPVAELG